MKQIVRDVVFTYYQESTTNTWDPLLPKLIMVSQCIYYHNMKHLNGHATSHDIRRKFKAIWTCNYNRCHTENRNSLLLLFLFYKFHSQTCLNSISANHTTLKLNQQEKKQALRCICKRNVTCRRDEREDEDGKVVNSFPETSKTLTIKITNCQARWTVDPLHGKSVEQGCRYYSRSPPQTTDEAFIVGGDSISCHPQATETKNVLTREELRRSRL